MILKLQTVIMSNKHTVGEIFCDLSKAFDCVNHRILLSKLEHYGIRGTFGALIKSYLTERCQRVAIEDKTNTINYSNAIEDKTNTINYSNWELVRHGVSQDSILSPLLFLLYVNDLPKVTTKNAKLVLHADDTSFIITNPSSIEFCNKLNKMFC